MKASSVNPKSSSSSSNSKSKKSSKEREKRKSQSDKPDNPEKGSPTKDSTRKYSGIGPDSIVAYSEQSNFEHLSDEVCYGFAEDLSYKLRYVIHDALIRARLSGRNHIVSADIDATFESLNVDKVYGAPSAPNWIPFGDQNLYYLDDAIVNLVDIAEEDCSYVQPGDVTVTKKWYPETKDVNKPLKNYFETICSTVVSQDIELRHAALKDIKANNYIGPIVEWFYNFCYILLSKDITYDCLTLSALDLIKSLEQSNVAPQIVSEKQLKLVVRLILQRLLRSYTTPEVLKPMCYTLALLSERVPIRDLVLTKLKQKLPEIKHNFTLPILTIINALGMPAVNEVFLPNMRYLLLRAENQHEPEFVSAILSTYNIICKDTEVASEVHAAFYDAFGDGISNIWRHYSLQYAEQSESNWLSLKTKLIKTRKKVPYENKPCKKYTLMEAFPDNQFFRKKLNQNIVPLPETQHKPSHVTIGKRSLLISVLQKSNTKKEMFNRCIGHGMMHTSL